MCIHRKLDYNYTLQTLVAYYIIKYINRDLAEEFIVKTLILNGSPRKNGDTASLIEKITEKIVGEYRIVDAYRCNISPCFDCRYCWENSGCVINDEMQEIYKYIQECDNIMIASPLYFSELTGKLLDVGSRLQTYFCARFFRLESKKFYQKNNSSIWIYGIFKLPHLRKIQTPRKELFHV